MAEDPVERAARIRKSLADTVKELRGDVHPPAARPHAATEGGRAKKVAKSEKEKAAHDRDVNALLEHTRAVIDHTRRVIEQTRASLQTHKDGGGAGET